MAKKIYSAYDVPESEGITFKHASLTQQHFKKECDINNIIKRYQTTGILGDPLKPIPKPIYEDVSDVPSFQESMQSVARTTEFFESLPSEIKQQFNFSVDNFVNFVADPANNGRLNELGLLDTNTNPSDSNSSVAPSPMPLNQSQDVEARAPIGDGKLETEL